MLKNIFVSGLLVLTLQAESFQKKPISFDIFLQKAITTSPYLKSSALAVDQAQEQGSALMRYANPTVELELSQFNPDGGDSDNGYRVNYSQPIRLWSISDDKKALADTMVRSANASFVQERAAFVRDISLRYSSYAQQKMLLGLGNDELEIAKNIYMISKARYDSGTISRGVMLQAKVAYEMVQIANESLVLSFNQSYFNLLKFAGIHQQINLETSYVFEIKKSGLANPSLSLLQSQKEISLNEAELNSNSVEWMNTFVEYESEPDQDIIRGGVNFPLAIFNTKSQEKMISKLQASRTQLLITNENSRLNIDNERLKKERDSLQRLQSKNEKILSTELELLKMFKEGYKIANINLLELQDIKNKVISTKESLIQIKIALDQNAIYTNYNQGSYNE